MLQMDQKDYKLEIVSVLMGGEGYVRDIARKIEINHMMVVRKMKELLDENVVEVRTMGAKSCLFS